MCIVMPCFNDWEAVEHLVPEIDAVFSPIDVMVNVILVDDCSSQELDTSEIFSDVKFSAIKQVSRIGLTRNVGSQRAIAIGVAYAAEHEIADYMIVADSDGQDKPEDMPRLIQACIEENNKNIVFAMRSKRSENVLFRVYYFIYQMIFKILTQTRISMGSFSASPWKHVFRLVHLGELWNHFPGAVIRSGIPYSQIECDRGYRGHGESKMKLAPLLAHAFSGFSLFSDIAAARLLILGFYSICVLVAIAAGLVGLKIFSDIPLVGWTSTLLGVLGVIFMQVLTASGMLLLMVSFMRMQVLPTPKQEYEKYVYESGVVYPKTT